MDYIQAIACPVCGHMNKVPENMDILLKTFVVRGATNPQEASLFQSILDELTEPVRASVQKFLARDKRDNSNNWIDVECINTKRPYGKHGFRFNLVTGEVQK